MHVKILKFSILFLFLITFLEAYSQNNVIITKVRGIVIDAESQEPLSFVGVTWLNKSNNGTLTDEEGNFLLTAKDTTSRIFVSCIGYKNNILKIRVGKTQTDTVRMIPDIKAIKDVVVKPKKIKYRNKGNPAVELIDRVIKNKSKNREEGLGFYTYEKYEKLQFSLSDVSQRLENSKILSKFKFVFDNVDTSVMPGKKVVPIFLKETLSDVYYRKTPLKNDEFVKADRIVRFDEYLNSRSISNSLRFLYQNINIYDNNINLLSNQFISPISAVAPTFYKYFIMDTVIANESKCVRLSFFPRNKTDFLFQGQMYVMLDSSYAVKKIDMTINKDINLNWVKELSIVQEFEKISDKGWILTTDETSIDFGITQEQLGVYGQRKVSYKNFQFDESKADSIYASLKKTKDQETDNRKDEFWLANRHFPLSKPEQRIYSIMDSVKHLKAFKRAMDITFFASSGYIGSRGDIEIGPANTFYSYNPIEGSRIRFGGRTTPRFSKKIYFDAYGAYGTSDKKYKYNFSATYLFTHKTIFDYPLKTLKISYQNDIQIPGQELQYTQENNVLLSFKRGSNDKMYYNKTFKVEHLNEFQNHFSYSVGYEFTREIPTGNLFYNQVDYLLHTNDPMHIDISQMNFSLRYAPNEQFFQGKVYRNPIVNKYPVLQIHYSIGSKLIGSDFDYSRLQLDASKRFYLSFLGYTDVTLEGGKIFGKVPYPLLDIHRANQTYSYQPLSYNLMNFLEFVSDKYVALYADHCFNGFFLNKIPLMKRLKFREFVTAKVLYGGISSLNDPNSASNLFRFPVNDQGKPITYTFGNKPYVETSVGVSNILKFFRVDYVQRITYLDHPNISKTGVRVSVKVDF
jgi:hypothetical protein